MRYLIIILSALFITACAEDEPKPNKTDKKGKVVVTPPSDPPKPD